MIKSLAERPLRSDLVACMEQTYRVMLNIMTDPTIPASVRVLAWKQSNQIMTLIHDFVERV